MWQRGGEIGGSSRRICKKQNTHSGTAQAKWLKKMKESDFFVILKKNRVVECAKHRTFSITGHVAKIVLKVLYKKLKRKVEDEVDKAQFEFRNGMGTKNAIFMLKPVNERVLEKQKDVYMCFIDFEKVFDTVQHETRMKRLRRLGDVEVDLRVLTNL